VTSTFKRQPAIELELPSSMSTVQVAEGPAVLYLTSDGAIYLDEQPLTEDQIVPALRQRQAEGGEDNIVLRSDTHTEFGRVVSLMGMIKASGFSRVSISARSEGADAGGAP